jgi:hypothetical protein
MADVPYLTEREVLDAHAQFGKLNWHMVKAGMGPNWPAHWEMLGPGEAIFDADEGPHS